MIKFPCKCGNVFNLTDDMAGGMLQCPRCGLLNDIPTLGELANLSEDGTVKLAERSSKGSSGDLGQAVDLEYRLTLSRTPSSAEKDSALTFVNADPAKLKSLAWILLNLDEFMYVR